MNYDDELRMRPTRLNGDVAGPNDYVVMWRGITVGRILQQPGTPVGKPNWFWGVNLPGQPQPTAHRGICSDIEECKRRFKVVWSGRHQVAPTSLLPHDELAFSSPIKATSYQ
ncbi:hypothetical protein [Tardiphaga sp. 839_C3_N1_4]|uniref:hypothetical protein n=1 Tax=Tardiphaga sp. 839_C3_N1_4 TaxID=3240761 RepID=UPI003F23BED9